MKFKAQIHSPSIFTKFTASLASLGNVAWVRLDSNDIRFTIIPEQGTQVWAVLSIDTIFESYLIQSASTRNTINLEVPLQPLLRALRSASQATSASIRLTKRDGTPTLCITLTTSLPPHPPFPAVTAADPVSPPADLASAGRETIITQDIPVRVLSAEAVAGLHEPRCREPDVHVVLPPLHQLKSVSDRFTKLAGEGGRRGAVRLEMGATMHGELRLGVHNEALRIASVWTGLTNPELDPGVVEGGVEGVRRHPSTAMRERRGEEAWATVRIDGRDWGKVMSVGRLGGRVIACFCHEHALILYVYLSNDESGGEESVLTYYVSSYSA